MRKARSARHTQDRTRPLTPSLSRYYLHTPQKRMKHRQSHPDPPRKPNRKARRDSRYTAPRARSARVSAALARPRTPSRDSLPSRPRLHAPSPTHSPAPRPLQDASTPSARVPSAKVHRAAFTRVGTTSNFRRGRQHQSSHYANAAAAHVMEPPETLMLPIVDCEDSTVFAIANLTHRNDM